MWRQRRWCAEGRVGGLAAPTVASRSISISVSSTNDESTEDETGHERETENE